MKKKRANVRVYIDIFIQLFKGLVALAIAILALNLVVTPFIANVSWLTDLETQAIRGALLLIFISISYGFYIRLTEKRPVFELAYKPKLLVIAVVPGVLTIGITVLILFVFGYYQISQYHGFDNVALAIVALSAQAIMGEFIFRGVIFRVLENNLGTLNSSIIVSLVLGLLEALVAKPMLGELNLLLFVSIVLLNLMQCVVFVRTRNIWVVGAFSASWICSVFMLGILDDHWRINAPIETLMQGPTILTGGLFGPATSIISCTIYIAFLWFILKKRDTWTSVPA